MKQRRKGKFETICNFVKTEHFLYRQWDRKVDDNFLIPVLKKASLNNHKKFVIVSRKICKPQIGINLELFILIHGKTLITCFMDDISIHRFRSSRIQYEIIQII